MISAALLLLLPAPSCAQAAETPRSTTVPLDRDLGQRLVEYDAALADGRFERAASLLQELLDADPALLVSSPTPDLLTGAAAAAHARLAEAPAGLLTARRALLGERAAAALAAALAPPDAPALLEVARRFDGLDEARRARQALAELWEDRGQPDLAAAWDPRGDAAPALPPLPRNEPAAAARLPAVASVLDQRLPRLDAERLTPAWTYDFRQAQPFTTLVRHRIAIAGGLVYASDGYELTALEAGSGSVRWREPGDPRWERLPDGQIREMQEALSAHFLSVPVIAEGIVLCVLQEATPLGRADSYSRIDIRRLLPARRLHAFDAATGARLWSAATPWDDGASGEPRNIACGAPAVSAGRVYLPVYDAVGTIDLSLQCLDLRTGRALWKRFLASGQLETNLFGNVLRELATPPPLADAERVQVCSHLGTFHALDAATGEVLWTRLYPRIPVVPTETGRIADRPQLIASNLGVGDDTRVAWAPADSDRISLCDARSGRLLAAWPAVDEEYRHVAHLLALTPTALWATGSRVFALPLGDGSEPPDGLAPAEADGELALGRAGVLVQGEVLAPDGARTVERYDANTLAYRGRALDFGGDSFAAGALQAAPGLLFVVRPDGVSAWASLASLLAALREPALAAEALERLLPIAASLDLDAAPALARDLAGAAAAHAKMDRFAAQREALLDLAVRGWIAGGEPARAAPILAAWLDEESLHTLTACGLLLDEPMVTAADGALITRAVRVLEESGAPALRLRTRRAEPTPAVLARARALRALEGADSAEARAALAGALTLEDPGTLTVRGIPLLEWADAVLGLVVEPPAQAHAFEDEARRALDGRVLGERLLRAYGRTAAGQERLAAELRRDDLTRSERLERARWRRDWGDASRAWPELAQWLPESSALPPLPRALELGPRRAATGGLLAWQPAPPAHLRIFLPVYQQRRVVAVAFDARRAYEEHEYPLQNLRSGPTTMFSGAFATPLGCAVLLPDALLHFGADGSFTQAAPLAKYLEYDPLIPLGDGLAAAVFEGREGFLRVAVFDGVSGAIYLEEELPGSTGRRVELRRAGRWLHVLEQNAERAFRLDLHFRAPPLAYGLPMPMSATDLRTAIALDDGIGYLVNRSDAAAFAVRAAPGRAPWVRVFERAEVLPVRCGPGLAWIVLPLAADAARVAPRSLHWLAPGATETWTRELGSTDARLAELDFPRPFDARGSDAIVMTPDADGATRVTAHRLGGDAPAWSLRLDEPAFAALRPLQPQPRRAADGWVISLLQSQSPTERARMHVLLVDDRGELLARRALDSGLGSVTEFWAEPVAGGVLVRNGDHYLLMGEFE